MKVCILGDNGSVHVQKWISGIAVDANIELHVVSFDKGVKVEGVHYHYLKNKFNSKLDYLLNLFRAKKIIRTINPDVLHAHYATSYGLLGAFSRFRPFIITGWGADIFDSPNSFIMRKILNYSLSKADAITVLSKISKNEIQKLTAKSIEIIPFGVDLDRFLPNLVEEEGLVRIGTIRTLTEKYGVEFLIRAFAELCEKYEFIRLEIVGDGPLKESLKQLAIDLGVEQKVCFHGYINQNSDFNNYLSVLNSFDIFAILSIIDSETFGVAAVEASACSIPVVATYVGGLPEVIENEITGILIEPKNVKDTVVALERLIVDADLRKKMGIEGRKNVENNFDWKKNVNQMIELYKKQSK